MIKFLVMDVDGTLTDGKVYIGGCGELFKAFDVKDGCGIKDILPESGIVPVIITGRKSEILQRRCEELCITNIYQGVQDKLEKLNSIISEFNRDTGEKYLLRNCAYIGDDVPDLESMIAVKEAGGVVGCPADAVLRVKEFADFVSENDGGNGAVREFIEWIVNKIV